MIITKHTRRAPASRCVFIMIYVAYAQVECIFEFCGLLLSRAVSFKLLSAICNAFQHVFKYSLLCQKLVSNFRYVQRKTK